MTTDIDRVDTTWVRAGLGRGCVWSHGSNTIVSLCHVNRWQLQSGATWQRLRFQPAPRQGGLSPFLHEKCNVFPRDFVHCKWIFCDSQRGKCAIVIPCQWCALLRKCTVSPGDFTKWLLAMDEPRGGSRALRLYNGVAHSHDLCHSRHKFGQGRPTVFRIGLHDVQSNPYGADVGTTGARCGSGMHCIWPNSLQPRSDASAWTPLWFRSDHICGPDLYPIGQCTDRLWAGWFTSRSTSGQGQTFGTPNGFT